MTWFIYALLWVLFSSFENLIDKKLVTDKEDKIDWLISSFYRNFAFYIILLLVGILFYSNTIEIFITLPIILYGGIHICRSLLYDYFLKKSEVTRYSSITFLFPLILILIDKYVFNIGYTVINIIWIFLLIIWWYIITINFSNNNIKKTYFSLSQWGMILVSFLIILFQLIMFKYYNTHYWLDEMSFYLNTWFFVLLFFWILILIKKKSKILISTAKNDWFLMKTFISKFFDTLGWLLILKALTLTSITNVYIVGSFSPLIMFLISIFLYLILKVNLKEDFSKNNLLIKLLASIIFLIGSYMIIY